MSTTQKSSFSEKCCEIFTTSPPSRHLGNFGVRRGRVSRFSTLMPSVYVSPATSSVRASVIYTFFIRCCRRRHRARQKCGADSARALHIYTTPNTITRATRHTRVYRENPARPYIHTHTHKACCARGCV